MSDISLGRPSRRSLIPNSRLPLGGSAVAGPPRAPRSRTARALILVSALGTIILSDQRAEAQLIDQTQAPNTAGEGIALSLEEQIGRGRGDVDTPDSAVFIIMRDPARAIRRGRQLFQRKFGLEQGLGPRPRDGIGDIENTPGIGAGISDSCAGCHGRPRGSAGFGGVVATRPDSRDAPHLFGLGLQEQLADEITRDLRGIRDLAVEEARRRRRPVTFSLQSKGIDYGEITARRRGRVDTSDVRGVDRDLRVRPFFAQGKAFSIREFIVGAFQDEMGLQSFDPCLLDAANGRLCETPSGMVLDGSIDRLDAPPVSRRRRDGDRDGVVNEIDAAVVDFMEFYLLNYFKPGLGEQSARTRDGFRMMESIGCTGCHVRDLDIDSDRRVADVETLFDPVNGTFNRLFATASTLFYEFDDGRRLPQLLPERRSFVVENIFTDFQRHDLGPAFHELNYDGLVQTEFMTEPLWGVGSTAPYGHDGRSMDLTEVILRHGGEALASRNAFAALPGWRQRRVLAALNSLVLFPPDDTASNLDPGDRTDPDFPQIGHGSINLGALFQTRGPE
ncbi:MAG: thiol oxidoreductase-like protein [Inquilinus sp.]|nr:thiol oxidoreductase-like protein [Inquilinus sp.]